MKLNAAEDIPLFPILSRSSHGSPDPLALSLQSGLMVTSAVNVAVRLGLADLLETPKSLEILAQETQTHAPSLSQLLRALASIAIFQEIDQERHIFGNTERSRLLKSDAMADLIKLWGAPYQWDSWRDLIYTIQTGNPAMQKHAGPNTNIWTYLHKHPEENQAFQRGLTTNSNLILPAIVDAYTFSGTQSLVDVGGGHGRLAINLLQNYPSLSVILFDHASIIEQAQGLVSDLTEETATRYSLVAGDFFEAVPSGANCYVLKNVLMDWLDDDYLTIIHRCRQAMNQHGHILVIEPIITETASFTKFFSLQMSMMMKAAHHRTVEEHQALFGKAGFRLTQMIPLGLEQMLLEFELSSLIEEGFIE